MFWTDKALARYVKSVTQLLDSRNVRNVPQCRPIEQFFKCLSTSLQESLESSKHWLTRAPHQFCLKEVDPKVKTTSVESTVTRLTKLEQLGPLSLVH
jgi:hypothetical protein